jgi:hypothetical protein
MKLLKKLRRYGLKLFVKKAIEKIFNYRRTRIIQDLINLNNAETYVEIGVREGVVFKKIKNVNNKIAIDIDYREGMKKLAKNESFYHMASDDFFEKEAESVFKDKKIDIAFIDGYHEFYQVLRDFNHIEKYLSEKGIVIIHDCNPIVEQFENERGSLWNGDVWKAAFYINNYRNDVKFFTLNCDHGLGIAYGYNKVNTSNKSLEEKVNSNTLKEIKGFDYKFLKKNRRNKTNLKSPFSRKKRIKEIRNYLDLE